MESQYTEIPWMMMSCARVRTYNALAMAVCTLH